VSEQCICTRPDVACGGGGFQCSKDDFQIGTCPAGQSCWITFDGAECFCLPQSRS